MINTERKVRSMGFIIGFLLITNIIMLVFFLYHKDNRKSPHSRETVVATFLKNDIAFDDAQMTSYQVLKKQDMDSLKPYFTSLRESKDSFYTLVSVPANDADEASKSKLIGERQMLVEQQMLAHFRKVRKLCKPEQLSKFDSLFKNVIERITNGRMRKNHKE